MTYKLGGKYADLDASQLNYNVCNNISLTIWHMPWDMFVSVAFQTLRGCSLGEIIDEQLERLKTQKHHQLAYRLRKKIDKIILEGAK